MPFKQHLKILCQSQTSERRRRHILSSIKGYKHFKLISHPCICYLSTESVLKKKYTNTKRELHHKSTKRVRNSGRSNIHRKTSEKTEKKQFMLLQRVPEKRSPRKKKRPKRRIPQRPGKKPRKDDSLIHNDQFSLN